MDLVSCPRDGPVSRAPWAYVCLVGEQEALPARQGNHGSMARHGCQPGTYLGYTRAAYSDTVKREDQPRPGPFPPCPP